MKTIRFLCVCAAVLIALTSAEAADVNLGGFAKITNYEGQWTIPDRYLCPGQIPSGTWRGFYDIGSLLGGTSSITPSVRNKTTGLPPSMDSSQNCLYFALSGPARYGDFAGDYGSWSLGVENYHHVAFDWITNFTSGGDCVKLDISYYNAPGSFWSIMPGTGYHTGHVDMDITAPDTWDIYFRVSVVPEPSSLLAVLSGLGGMAAFGAVRRRAGVGGTLRK
jgi:hypothetical protein